MTITPSVDPALLRPEPRLLVTIVRIDKALVEELGRVALLPDLSFGQGDDHRSGKYAILDDHRSEEHTSELQSLMRISYAVFCLKKKKTTKPQSLHSTNK